MSRAFTASLASTAWLLCATASQARAADANAIQTPSLEQRIKRIEEENAELKAKVDSLQSDQGDTNRRVDTLMPLLGRFFGYVDFGAFFVQGNGSGIRSDFGHRLYPQYGDIAEGWVFYGDPLATTINSRGEPADLDSSRALTFDGINNGGKFSFLINAVNFAIFSGITDNLTVNASIDFVPRGRNMAKTGVALGDFLDLKLGYIEYTLPTEAADIRIYAGKFDSVLGVEYRSQDAPDRMTVTPSLACRYTCGRPVGVKVRARFLDDALVANLAITNGSNFVENFAFSNEIDTNFFKTASLRLSYKIPVGSGLDIGVSGAVGAQDYQQADNVMQWHAGADMHLEWRDFDFMAEFVTGRAMGKESLDGTQCGDAPCLRYQAAYGLLGYRALNWLMPYVRVDWREANHRDGVSFVYISQVLRTTGGLHFEVGEHLVIKAEYTHIFELGRQPQFNNDVATSALVVKY